MSVEQNKAVVRRLFEEVVNGRDLAALDAVAAEDVVTHTTVPGGVEPGRESLRAFIAGFLDAFPDQHATLHEVMADGDRVVVRHSHRGAHLAPFGPIPPTGRPIDVAGVEIFRVAEGRIAEWWHHDDIRGLLEQIVAIPAPEPAC